MNDEEIIVDVGVGDGKSALKGASRADNGCGVGGGDEKQNTARGCGVCVIVLPLRGLAGLLALDGGDAGEGLAFDGFEHGTTTGGDVGYLIGETELVDSCY